MRSRARSRARGGVRLPPLVLDFRAASWGFGTEAPTGCGYTRAACASSVQTGTGTLFDLSALSAVAGLLAWGRALDAWDVGLVLEEPRTNLITYGRDYAQASWTVFGSALRTSGQSDPFGGTGASRIQAPSGTHGLGETIRTSCAGISTASAWLKSASGTAAPNLNTDRSSARIATSATAAATWGRLSFTATGGGAETTALVPVDGRDWSGIGGVAAGTRDFYVDACQREVGAYPTSYIPTAGAITTRNATFLRALSATVAPRLATGRLSLELKLRPMGARTEYGGTTSLWYVDANNQAAFVPSTGVLTITVAGSTNTVTLPSWARYDLVELSVQCGGGLATVVKYRLNSGSVMSLAVTGSALGTHASGDLYLCSTSSAQHLSCWLYTATFHPNGTAPAWAA